jgi:hypothetical protein
VYTLKVTLEGVEPPIWRRFRVSGSLTLERLHAVLQRVMGWQDSHLHEFEVGGRTYGHPVPDEPEYEVEPERELTLREAAPRAGSRFRYAYDLGDDWQHEIRVEAIAGPDEQLEHTICLAGQRACPPDDCGGIGGYEELLEVLANPRHPEHKSMVMWAGKGFDPEAFDLAKVNRKLRPLK